MKRYSVTVECYDNTDGSIHYVDFCVVSPNIFEAWKADASDYCSEDFSDYVCRIVSVVRQQED